MFKFNILTTNITINKIIYAYILLPLYQSFSNRKDTNTLFALFFNHFTACLILKPKFFLCISVQKIIIFFSWGRLLEIHRFPDQAWKLMQMTSTSTLILCDSHMRKIHLIKTISYFFHFLPYLSSS